MNHCHGPPACHSRLGRACEVAAVSGSATNAATVAAVSDSVRASWIPALRTKPDHWVIFIGSSVNGDMRATGRVVGSGVFRRSKVARMACTRTAPSKSKLAPHPETSASAPRSCSRNNPALSRRNKKGSGMTSAAHASQNQLALTAAPRTAPRAENPKVSRAPQAKTPPGTAPNPAPSAADPAGPRANH